MHSCKGYSRFFVNSLESFSRTSPYTFSRNNQIAGNTHQQVCFKSSSDNVSKTTIQECKQKLLRKLQKKIKRNFFKDLSENFLQLEATRISPKIIKGFIKGIHLNFTVGSSKEFIKSSPHICPRIHLKYVCLKGFLRKFLREITPRVFLRIYF